VPPSGAGRLGAAALVAAALLVGCAGQTAPQAVPPGGYLLVIGTTNIAAFRAFYGLDESVAILAAYTGSLNNGGEQLTIRTSAGGTDIISCFALGSPIRRWKRSR